jgi:hypothetical protein
MDVRSSVSARWHTLREHRSRSCLTAQDNDALFCAIEQLLERLSWRCTTASLQYQALQIVHEACPVTICWTNISAAPATLHRS